MQIKKPTIDLMYLGMVLIILIHLPFMILGEDTWVSVQDNLDNEFIYPHLLKINNTLFGFDGSTIIPNVFNGLPRFFIHSEFSFIRVLFYFFPSFWAYVLNSLFVQLIGFMGFVLLARDYFPSQKRKYVIYLLAFTFAILPFFMKLAGLCLLGQPLLLWAFFNLRDNKKYIISFLIIILYPFYSHFAMSGPFYLVALSIYGIYYMITKKNKIGLYWSGIVSLFIMFILCNYITLYGFLFSGITSFRSKWQMPSSDFLTIVQTTIETFFFGHWMAVEIITIPIVLLAGYAIWKKIHKRFSLIIILSIIGALCIFEGIYPWLRYELRESLPILTAFQFRRFIIFIPLLYFIVLLIINQEKRIKSIFIYIVVFVQLVTVMFSSTIALTNREIIYNWMRLLLPAKMTERMHTYETFFAEELFQEIDDYIGKPKESYRVVCLGFFPSIPQYNGFYTLDGYFNNYPYSYKVEFREIIADELEKKLDSSHKCNFLLNNN